MNMSKTLIDSQIKNEHSDSLQLLNHRKLIHDLRNGLSPILMQAQLLLIHTERKDLESGAIRESARAIERSVHEIINLLDNK